MKGDFMKTKRQEKILAIINSNDIQTQEDLIDILCKEGYKATQATISRDIREMKLSKLQTRTGAYRYYAPVTTDKNNNVKFNNVLVESIIKVNCAQNLVVMKTYAGLAQAVATGIDALNNSDILGCVAGDDTIIIVTTNNENAKKLSEKIKIIL